MSSMSSMQDPYSVEDAWSAINTAVAEHRAAVVSATIVGSMAPLYWSETGWRSDIDLVVITPDLVTVSELARTLESELRSKCRRGHVVAEWVKVIARDPTTPVVHLLADSYGPTLARSGLFRRNVSKYPPIHGTPLSDWSSKDPITVYELLTDLEGPKRKLERLRARDFVARAWRPMTGAWHLTETETILATKVDHAIFAAIQATRDTLRFLQRHIEGCTLPDLVTLWRGAQGPLPDALETLVAAKTYQRECLAVPAQDGERLTALATLYLDTLTKWLEAIE